MKYLLTLIFNTLIILVFCQDIDSLGIENNTLLNKQESKFLNSQLSAQNNNFDFTNKLVACFYYSGDFYPRSKIEFFAEAKSNYISKKDLTDKLIILTPKERSKYEGFDIILLTGYKYEIDKKTRKIILKELKELVLNIYYGDDYYFE